MQNPGIGNVTAFTTARPLLQALWRGKRERKKDKVLPVIASLSHALTAQVKMARARYDATAPSNQTTGLPNRGLLARIAGSFFFSSGCHIECDSTQDQTFVHH